MEDTLHHLKAALQQDESTLSTLPSQAVSVAKALNTAYAGRLRSQGCVSRLASEGCLTEGGACLRLDGRSSWDGSLSTGDPLQLVIAAQKQPASSEEQVLRAAFPWADALLIAGHVERLPMQQPAHVSPGSGDGGDWEWRELSNPLFESISVASSEWSASSEASSVWSASSDASDDSSVWSSTSSDDNGDDSSDENRDISPSLIGRRAGQHVLTHCRDRTNFSGEMHAAMAASLTLSERTFCQRSVSVEAVSERGCRSDEETAEQTLSSALVLEATGNQHCCHDSSGTYISGIDRPTVVPPNTQSQLGGANSRPTMDADSSHQSVDFVQSDSQHLSITKQQVSEQQYSKQTELPQLDAAVHPPACSAPTAVRGQQGLTGRPRDLEEAADLFRRRHLAAYSLRVRCLPHIYVCVGY